MKNSSQKIGINDVSNESNANMKENEFQAPTLDQFMELITDEQKSVVSSPSGYNVYNKYHKSS
ncbi:MAG: hypothetical protein P5702_17890 [Limnospira sp. PMC 1291.21]|uniref:Uncharacterized protein n=1 Tax=Limnospira indica PCC 8005 TaxID=376219 RepID=A0A9P1KID0_9CYAN|nr:MULTISPECIES: hypothetical protein [Limnospira]MDT9179388.1 hypothetical protein [Limnospira sp. PMC 1238.20]MDT9194598.1 hypothetical protein [Limnospira sp. PMC 1245.20]MDT9204683.1 hypothetical protein [Limnospira sp. PMC 1243.20]MDT9209728.1 hypothetical protein [Limnospira sp. PMC 1252.20]MDT9215164.1 hypothetical protein [Limnospira sp. PMC 1256.20]